MIVVGVINKAFFEIGRHCDERNARTVAEEVELLDIAGIIIAAAFIEGDEDRRRLPKSRIRLHASDDGLHELLVKVQLRIRRVPGQSFRRTQKGYRWERVVLNIVEE